MTNDVVSAVKLALEQASSATVFHGGATYGYTAADCPLRAVRSYFVRAMDEAIEGAKAQGGE